VYEDEWRVEVDLDDEEHGYGLGERLRAHDLDNEARKRLGRRAIVTRDRSRLFLYTRNEGEAHEAERVARELVEAENLSAEIEVTRWDPREESWKSIPSPRTPDEERTEAHGKEEGESDDAEDQSSLEWLVKVALPTREEASSLEERLSGEGFPVHRRWRYVTVDVATEDRANELGSNLTSELPDAEVWIDAKGDDIPHPTFVLLESRL
jgi:hypothetical protein